MSDYDLRRKLLAECKMLEIEHKKKIDELCDNEELDDEEFERALSKEQNEYESKYDPLWLKAFALQYPRRTGWFADTFVSSFGTCENKRLSVKQTEVFSRYCAQDDATWTTGKTYCILVTSHNRKLEEVLSLLRVYMPETNIGFSVQDEIIKTCSHNGISIKTESR